MYLDNVEQHKSDRSLETYAGLSSVFVVVNSVLFDVLNSGVIDEGKYEKRMGLASSMWQGQTVGVLLMGLFLHFIQKKLG